MLWKTGLIFLCWGLTSGELQERQSGTPAAPARTTLDFGFVPSGVYDTVAYYEPGAIGILFNMMHAFLYVVQPNPFPEGELNLVMFLNFWAPQETSNLTFPYSWLIIWIGLFYILQFLQFLQLHLPYHEQVREVPPVMSQWWVRRCKGLNTGGFLYSPRPPCSSLFGKSWD